MAGDGEMKEWPKFKNSIRITHGAKIYDIALEKIVGDLGIEYGEDGWNIYHIPTLSLFSKAVPEYETAEYELQDLINWMVYVQSQKDTAWIMLRQLTPQNYADRGETAKKIIQEWCLSCPVV